MRYSCVVICSGAAFIALLSAQAVNAQQLNTASIEPIGVDGLNPPNLSDRELSLRPIAATSNANAFIAKPPRFDTRRTYRRSHSLIAMYVAYGLLQGLDAESTIRGIRNNSTVEANPILSPFASNPVAFVAVKAALAAGTIYAVDRLHKYHPRLATSLMASINAAYAGVVVHNYKDFPSK